jgi:MCP family monocarboxylic acid transporter-like MFS transporter 14
MIMVVFGVLGGISHGCAYMSCIVVLVTYFDKKLGIANGLTMAGSGLGTFVFAPLTKLMLVRLGWKYTMVIYGAVILPCCALGIFLRPVKNPHDDMEQDQ